jgi:uncharacterized protein
MEQHTITHIEIPAPDLQKAVEFYTKIFNWEIEIMPDGTYAMFKIGKTNSGGGLDSSTSPAPENVGPGIVIDVDDINLKLAEIENAGGKIAQAKTEIPGGYGFFAKFKDPNGNYLQLHSKK